MLDWMFIAIAANMAPDTFRFVESRYETLGDTG